MMTMINFRQTQLYSIAVLVAVFGMLYWLDTVHVKWQRQIHQTREIITNNFFTFAIPAIVVLVVVFLAWFLLIYSKPTWLLLISCFFIGISDLFFISPLATTLPTLTSLTNNLIFTGISNTFHNLGYRSTTVQVGSFVLGVGFIILIQKLTAILRPLIYQQSNHSQ